MTMLEIQKAPKPLIIPASDVAALFSHFPNCQNIRQDGFYRVEDRTDGGMNWYWEKARYNVIPDNPASA